MFLRFFLKLGWHLLLAASLGLMGLCFWIPYWLFSDIFLEPVVAAAGASAMLSCRVLASFHCHFRQKGVIPPSWSVTALQWMLPLLSLTCSVIWFEALFEPPDAEDLRRLDRAEIHMQFEARIAEEKQRIRESREAALSDLSKRYRLLASGVDARRLPGIRELERRLQLALNDSASRSLAHRLNEQLEHERTRHGRDLAVLQAERRTEVLSLNVGIDKAHDKIIRDLITARQSKLDRIGRTDYRKDQRLRSLFLDRLEKITQVFPDQSPSRQKLLIGLALLCGLILELAIWLALQHLVLVFGPLLVTDYRRRLNLIQRRIEIESELHAAQIDERLLRKRVENARGKLEQRMHQAVNEIAS